MLPALQRQVEIAVAGGDRETAMSLAREVQKLRPKEAIGFVTEASVLALTGTVSSKPSVCMRRPCASNTCTCCGRPIRVTA